MKKTGDYYVIVVEDTNVGQIVATGTLITEHKYIHACSKVNLMKNVDAGSSQSCWVKRWCSSVHREDEWKRWWSATRSEGSSSENCKLASAHEAVFPHLRNLSFKVVLFSEGVALFHVSHRLVSTLTLLSKNLKCYKVTLECSPQNMAFYQKFGYEASAEAYMQRRFFD